jgi:hypothetical protein
MKLKLSLLLITVLCSSLLTTAQQTKTESGAWYLLVWKLKSPEKAFGLQGDFQLRLWAVGNDLEQTMARMGCFYQPKGRKEMYTAGYANIQTETYGTAKNRFNENRYYIEALLPQKAGKRFTIKHRLRHEYRFVQNRDFSTRYRQAIFLTVPISSQEMQAQTIFLSFYNEIFLNERIFGTNRQASFFDQNRLYGAVGYAFTKQTKLQVGAMQHNTNRWSKHQLQIGINHTFVPTSTP